MLSSRVRSDEILRMSGILNYYLFTPSLLAAPFPRSLKEVIVDEVNEAGEVVTVATDEYTLSFFYKQHSKFPTRL